MFLQRRSVSVKRVHRPSLSPETSDVQVCVTLERELVPVPASAGRARPRSRPLPSARCPRGSNGTAPVDSALGARLAWHAAGMFTLPCLPAGKSLDEWTSDLHGSELVQRQR